MAVPGSPLLHWRAAIADEWAPYLWMHCAMTQAVKEINCASEAEDWAKTVGPAGAVVASGRRLGWSFPTVDEFCSHRGRHRWRQVTMGELACLVREAVDIWRWSRARQQLEADLAFPRACGRDEFLACTSVQERLIYAAGCEDPIFMAGGFTRQ